MVLPSALQTILITSAGTTGLFFFFFFLQGLWKLVYLNVLTLPGLALGESYLYVSVCV